MNTIENLYKNMYKTRKKSIITSTRERWWNYGPAKIL